VYRSLLLQFPKFGTFEYVRYKPQAPKSSLTFTINERNNRVLMWFQDVCMRGRCGCLLHAPPYPSISDAPPPPLAS
jgi:hypothetical protein